MGDDLPLLVINMVMMSARNAAPQLPHRLQQMMRTLQMASHANTYFSSSLTSKGSVLITGLEIASGDP
jgi:hypothetical protein